jgi:hypothetical protein
MAKATFSRRLYGAASAVGLDKAKTLFGTVTQTQSGSVFKPAESANLEMPESALYGRLGKLAKEVNLPIGAAYPALIGVFSVTPDHHEMAGVRVNQYVCMLGESGSGKNVAFDRAMEALEFVTYANQSFAKTAPTGSRILMQIVGDKPAGGKNVKGAPRIPGPRKMLIRSNEISDCFLAGRSETSTLINRLTDFWDTNEFQLPDGKGAIQSADCRLSWIGGLPTKAEDTEKFLDIFGRKTGDGLYNRFIFGYVSEPIDFDGKHAWKKPDPFAKVENLTDDYTAFAQQQYEIVLRFDDAAWKMYRDWKVPEGQRLRLHAKKIAVLTASANLESTVTAECMAAAIVFVEWQAQVRSVFNIGVSENLEGAFTERALSAFERAARKGEQFDPARLAHDGKWSKKFGQRIVQGGIKSFKESYTIIPAYRELSNGKWHESERWYYLNPQLYVEKEFDANKAAVEKNKATFDAWWKDFGEDKKETPKDKVLRLKKKVATS